MNNKYMTEFKVALPGVNVRSAKFDELVLSSVYPSPKIDTRPGNHVGIIFLNWVNTAPVANGTIKLLCSFPHGYGYIPTVFAAYRYDDGATVRQGTLGFQLGALGMIIIDADIKNINLKYYSFDLFGIALPQFTMRVRYYVMAERGFESGA